MQVCLALGDYQSSLNAVLAIMQPGTGAGRVEAGIAMQVPNNLHIAQWVMYASSFASAASAAGLISRSGAALASPQQFSVMLLSPHAILRRSRLRSTVITVS